MSCALKSSQDSLVTSQSEADIRHFSVRLLEQSSLHGECDEDLNGKKLSLQNVST